MGNDGRPAGDKIVIREHAAVGAGRTHFDGIAGNLVKEERRAPGIDDLAAGIEPQVIERDTWPVLWQ